MKRGAKIFAKAIAFARYICLYRLESESLMRAKAANSFAALWRFLQSSCLAGIAQKAAEFEAFISVVQPIEPRVIVEIGTAQGGTLLFWAWVASKEAHIITIDLPGGAFGGGHRRSQDWFFKRFAQGRQRISFVRGDSHDPQTYALVRSLLRGRQVDLLFIDGDHSLEGVERDYCLYSPLVRHGGIVAFHDIVPAPYELVGGVPSLWTKLKVTGDVHEIVEDWNQAGFGIGWFQRQ